MTSAQRAFLGNFTVAIDAKQRLAIPVSLRETLQKSYAEESDRVIVTLATGDAAVAVYPASVFNDLMETLQQPTELNDDSQALMMLLTASARECAIDKQGRIRLPEDLMEYAGLGKEAVVCGHQSRIQIWNPDAWKEFMEQARSSLADLRRRTVQTLRHP